MSTLILTLVLLAPGAAAAAADRPNDRVSCSVDVNGLDDAGRVRPARRFSAGYAPAVVFRGKAAGPDGESSGSSLIFVVFNPRGQRYQVLHASPLAITKRRGGHRVERASRLREATMAVAGSSIAWTSMYGRWRVEPRIEGDSEACGRAEYFTIRP
jgi:hypothetical protein